jgi:hypothetical protein
VGLGWSYFLRSDFRRLLRVGWTLRLRLVAGHSDSERREFVRVVGVGRGFHVIESSISDFTISSLSSVF